MLSLEAALSSWELKVAATILTAAAAFAGGYAVRRIRRALAGRGRAVILDLASATAITSIVVLAAVLVAEIWGQTEVLVDQFGFLRVDERAPEVAITIVILIAIQVFGGIAKRLLDDLRDESETLTDHQREVGVRITQLSLWGVGIMVILGVWDVDLTGLLVGAGFLGIVLGLAARSTLGSLIAGLVLMFSRPFEVGEWIAVGEKEGMVTDITLMTTRLRAFDGERIVVPNDVVTGEIVTNRSREGRLRAEVEVGIDYDDDIGTAVELAQSTAETVAADYAITLETPGPDVLVRRLGDSAIVLSVRVWVEDPTSGDINRVRHQLLGEVKVAFDEAGISIPFPQRALSARAGEWDGSMPEGEPEHD